MAKKCNYTEVDLQLALAKLQANPSASRRKLAREFNVPESTLRHRSTNPTISLAKKRNYTEDDLQLALAKLRENPSASRRKLAREFNVPEATLRHRSTNPIISSRRGPAPLLSIEQEQRLADWIIDSANRGFPLRRDNVREAAVKMLKGKELCSSWMKRFLNRHPEITKRVPKYLSLVNTKLTENDIRSWFHTIGEYIKRHDYSEVLEDGSRIFNCDESEFSLSENIPDLATKGQKNITVLMTVSANGEIVPPMIIYPFERLPKNIKTSVPSDWAIANTKNASTKKDIFSDYITKVFDKYLIDNKIKRPVILYVDGHSSYLSPDLSNICKELEIIIIALYSNATHIMQHADGSVFKCLKNGWEIRFHDWRLYNCCKCKFPLSEFAPLLKCIIDEFLTPLIILNGFRACGLFPWNQNAVDYSQCITSGNSIESVTSGMISFEKFKYICGNALLSKLDNGTEITGDECINALKAVYEAFKDSADNLGESQTTVYIDEIEIIDSRDNFVYTEPVLMSTNSSSSELNETCYEPSQHRRRDENESDHLNPERSNGPQNLDETDYHEELKYIQDSVVSNYEEELTENE